ncbi:expressed unknown protein [Seminavis robusta]|uniref:Uncharacterized protein n=1 Tax=Seminavis robusta TaxID=568900 RepID=A0A9N8EGR8_9STRA|nr:expressed unknown protein [Seminavis robusta]|eukprot:Sro1057_g236300.1 n/a (177) ;mRNA; r:34891-35421
MASASSEDSKKAANDSLDGSLDGNASHMPRTRRQCPDDEDNNLNKILGKDAPRRSLSSELDGSLVIGDNWKNMTTVHKGRHEFGDSSDSLMDDSFAESFGGNSFASSQDSFAADEEDKIASQFTTLDDSSSGGGGGGAVTARRATPRRTYSKQRKTMPKKSDPLQAISEDDDTADS